MDKLSAKEIIRRDARDFVSKVKGNIYPYPADTVHKLLCYIMALTSDPECDFDKYGETVTNCDPWEPPSDCNVCPPTPKKFIVIAISKMERGFTALQLVKCWEVIGEDYDFKKAEDIAKAYIHNRGGLQCIIQEHVVYG